VSEGASVRLVVADHQRLFREGVASLMERASDIELVGQVATDEEALRLIAELQPGRRGGAGYSNILLRWPNGGTTGLREER